MLPEHNLWWKGVKDRHIEQWEQQPIHWQPAWIKQLSLTPFSLNFVLGPRQIGKTTGLKLLIQELTSRFPAEAIVYFNCDFIPDLTTFKGIIDEILQRKDALRHPHLYLFLDEVTNVPEWWRIIKGYIDLGKFKDDVLTLSGSSSLQLQKSMELFPGRRGHGQDILVNPLLFSRFLEVHGLQLSCSNDWKQDLTRAQGQEQEISRWFGKYLQTGGFPLAINEDPRAKEYFLKAVEGELVKNGKNLNLVREILSALLRKAPSPLNYSTIAKETSGYSYKTVQDYLDTFRNLFLIDYAYFKANKTVSYRKEKKIFFLDPFIARCFSSLYKEEFLEGALYEWIVQSHLLCQYGELFYFRNHYEIDCLAGDLKVEVKAGKPHHDYPKDVLVLDRNNLSLFLAVQQEKHVKTR